MAFKRPNTKGNIENTKEIMDQYIKAYAALGYFSGSVLVACGDRVILSKGYGRSNYELDVPNTPQTVFGIASITKQFTAMSVLQLQERGLLDLNDKLDKYIPGFPEGDKITLHHLLTNTSGIGDIVDMPEIMGSITHRWTVDEMIRVFKNKPIEFSPGTRFRYSNIGYLLLGCIIEQAGGIPYEKYLEENIFLKLGMVNTKCKKSEDNVIKQCASGYSLTGEELVKAQYFDISLFYGSGCLFSTIEDLYLWDRALYSEKLVGKASIERMFVPHVDRKRVRYGYGWYISDRGYFHYGFLFGFRSRISRYPDKKAAVILLSNLDTVPMDKMAKGLESILYGRRCRSPKLPDVLDIDKGIYNAYVGEYKTRNAFPELYSVSVEHQRLFIEYVKDFRKMKTELFPKSMRSHSDWYFASALDLSVGFNKDREGHITKAAIKQDESNVKAWKSKQEEAEADE